MNSDKSEFVVINDILHRRTTDQDGHPYVTGLRKNGLIAGLAKIDFFPEMASTKLRYCLSKI